MTTENTARLLDKLEIHENRKPTGLTAKLHAKLEKGLDHIADIKVTARHLYNPNERHDEAHEIEMDQKLMAIRQRHRFTSFAPEREGNVIKHFIDGSPFFHALSEMIDSAKSEIFMLGWWISPELYLRRPPDKFPEWRLDRLLKRKAEEGVKIYVIVYKEASNVMSLGSIHTKHWLEDMHPRIRVMRHPQHALGEVQLYWSHHEKLVVVDCCRATIGGLDQCFGRWDDRNHVLADCHPTDWKRSMFPGQDFNNARLMDFQTVDKFTSNGLSVADSARMPWHDTSMMISGPSVVDMCQHFIERWNFIKSSKYAKRPHYDWLSLPEPLEEIEAPGRAAKAREREHLRIEHPHMAKWAEAGTRFAHPFHYPPSTAPRAMEPVPEGQARVQVLRSAADWSHGIDPLECSIQDAYIQLITEANHTIYIENQFFITSTTGQGMAVTNMVGRAIAQRIISAARDDRPFRVIIIIPALPAFPGDVSSATALHAILQAQYNSIDRGPHSICQMVKDAGFDPEKYISWWNLRTYDRINYARDEIATMERNSGISFHQVQVAQARIWHGGEDIPHSEQVVNIQMPQGETGNAAQTAAKSKKVRKIKMPETMEEAERIIKTFQDGRTRNDRNVADSLAHHVFPHDLSLEQEGWNGSDKEERDAYMSELVYIHCKLMIVDSRRVIVGSANMNERSLQGSHDSEVAVCVEDMDMVETVMDGKPYMASRFAASWQRSLMREHLGLEPPMPTSDSVHPTPDMHGLPSDHFKSSNDLYDWGSPSDRAVEDVLSPDFWNLWHGTAQTNTAAFEKVFRPIPTDSIRTWADYKTYLGPTIGIKPGHVADPSLSLDDVKRTLGGVRGHLVPMSREFLCDVKDLTTGDDISVNSWTLPLYM